MLRFRDARAPHESTVPEPTGWQTAVQCAGHSFPRQRCHSRHPNPEMVSPSAQLPVPEAGAPRRSGAPTCDAPGGSERNAGAWRPRVCRVRRRSGRGLALGLAARCLLVGASCGAGQRTFPGRSGECSQHASICSSRGLPATAAAAGAPTRTPGLEEGRSLRPWTLLGWSGARLMVDPPEPLTEPRSCRCMLHVPACYPVRAVQAAFSLEMKFVMGAL